MNKLSNSFSGNSVVNQYLFFLPKEYGSQVTDFLDRLSNYSYRV